MAHPDGSHSDVRPRPAKLREGIDASYKEFAKLRALVNNWQTRIWLKGGYLRLMPYSISMR